jgi:hypothetical protein
MRVSGEKTAAVQIPTSAPETERAYLVGAPLDRLGRTHRNRTAPLWRASRLNPLNISSVKTPAPGRARYVVHLLKLPQPLFELEFFQP